MATKRSLLVSLLLQEKPPDYQQYCSILVRVSNRPSVLRNLFQDESTRDSVSLNIDRVLSRLQKLFEASKSVGVTQEVSEGLFQGIVLPLIRAQDDLLSIDQILHLFGSALPLVLRHFSSYLRQVAEVLLSIEGLLDRLLSHEAYSAILYDWFTSKGNTFDESLIKRITDKVIAMCDNCSADHNIEPVSQKWDALKKLVISLTGFIQTVEEQENMELRKSRDLPLLAGMTMLDRDDKKAYRARQQTARSLKVPESLLKQLAFFNTTKPESLRALQIALGKLQGEDTHSLMLVALESLPCRLCWERLTGSSTLPKKTLLTSETRRTDTNTKYDIFGQKIGLWKILLSDKALRSSRKLARTGVFNRVEQKLRELAGGDWKGKGVSHYAGSKQQRQAMKIPILQVMVTHKLFLLWQIDIGFYDNQPWVRQQIVKVWNIIPEEEVPNAIEQIILLQRSYSPEIIQMCRQQPLQQSDGKYLPRPFDNVKGVKSQYLLGTVNTIKSKDQAVIDMSNKFYNLTEPFLKSMLDATGREEFPFDLSPEEMEIVSHFNTSSLILGRSGTGKTTCLVFKILAKYRARQYIAEEGPVRQLLLTRSAYLASKLQTYARSLIETQCTGNVSKNLQSEDGVYPEEEPSMKNVSLFSLSNESYPFVCTYEEFLRVLDSTIKRADRKNFLHDENNVEFDSSSNVERPGIFRGQRVIDFNTFKIEYWGCLSGAFSFSCPPELLFSEIMGVIKGSSSSARTLQPLSRQEYLSKSCRLAPAFTTEAERSKVYSAFERYERLKRQRNEIDELDRVNSLLKSLKENPNLGQLIRGSFEEIYVDEVQDLRCLDIVLLLNCVCDLRGIHLAGDTAQCISKDSVFRFPEIKALFHEHYDHIADEIGQPELAKPTQFSLAKNYRSHQGILSLASCVMQMLWIGFPDTIDRLDPEVGQMGGPRPIVFAGFDSGILSAKMIGLVKLNDRIADFGAEQVILVRDDAAKDKLQKQIGEIALVLTILESKGMEFDDVLAYDFFSGSGLGSSYRCLHFLARGKKNQFDSQKHAALCSELKHLYVAITRARNQLWFVESSEDSVEPVLESLTENGKLELVEVVRQKDPDVAEKVKVLRAGGSVDPERWLKRGAHLLHQKNFADALFCFKKANDPKGMAQSQACLYEQQGRTCRSGNDMEGFAENYEKAISLFLEIALIPEAANCLEGLGKYEKAARLWKERKQYVRAAMLFEKASLFRDASKCYHLDSNYEQAVEVLRRGDQFDHLIDYISWNRDNILSSTLHRYSRLCNILLKQGRVSSDLRAKTIDLLGSDDDKEEFFKEFDMFDQLQSFYKSRGRYRELYDLSIDTGDLTTALEVAISHNMRFTVDGKSVEFVFNYVQAETILSRRGSNGAKMQQVNNLAETYESTCLAESALQWQAAMQLLHSIEDEEKRIEISGLKDGIVKDFFCLYVVSFEPRIVTRSTISNMPIDILISVGRLLHSLTSSDKKSYRDCLFLLFGIFDMPGHSKRTVTLPWSPLNEGSIPSNDYMSQEDAFKNARSWVLDMFSKALVTLDEAAARLWRQESLKRCTQFLVRGSCTRNRVNECRLLHDHGNVETYNTRIADLIKITLVFARITPLYLQRVMDDGFQRRFLGRRRRWLEILIEELTFVSSLDQAATAVVNARVHLQNNPILAAVPSDLEDLIFHRLGREWHERQSLTMMLEQVQLAHSLGHQVSVRFFRALTRRVGNTLLHRSRNTTSDELRIAFRAVDAAEKIRAAIAQQNSYALCDGIRSLLHSIESAEIKSFSAFQAVIAIFELTATYLLCMTNPRNAVGIPWSWAILYLPLVMQSQAASAGQISEQQKLIYGSCFLNLISSFCNLVHKLEWAMKNLEIVFNCGGNRTPSVAIKRRSVDLLTILALNLGHWPIAPRGFSDVWKQIQNVLSLSLSAPPGFTVSFQNLHRDFARSFQVYKGKDALHVVTLDDKDDWPLYLGGFITNGAKLIKLKAVLKVAGVSEVVSALPEENGYEPEGEDYTDRELEIVTRLQRNWRRILHRIQAMRKMGQAPKGATVMSLQTLCSSLMDAESAPLRSFSSKRKIGIRALLFTDGVTILTDLDEMSSTLQKLREAWKSRFQTTFEASELEELDSIHGQILHFESRWRELMQIWSIAALRDSIAAFQPEELKLKAREALRILRFMKQDTRAMKSKV